MSKNNAPCFRNFISRLMRIKYKKVDPPKEIPLDEQQLDPITYLKKYIEYHLDDQGDYWAYMHDPHLTECISSLNEEDSKNFSKVIFEWEEEIRNKLADPILFGENKFIDQTFLYYELFSTMDDLEKIEYFVENMIIYIPDFPLEKWMLCDLDFIQALKHNIERASETDLHRQFTSYRPAVAFLEEVIRRKNGMK